MKATKEYKIEMQAMAHALRIAKEKGIEGLEEELNMRGATKMPLTVSSAKGKSWMYEAARTTIETVSLIAVAVMRDEFGFGKKRIEQFLDRYAEKTDCLSKGYVDWEDLQEQMKQEIGIDFEVSSTVTGHRAEVVQKRREKELEEMRAKLLNAK